MGTSYEGLGENWTNGLDSYNKSIMVCPCVPFGVGLDKESKSRNISYTYLRKKSRDSHLQPIHFDFHPLYSYSRINLDA